MPPESEASPTLAEILASNDFEPYGAGRAEDWPTVSASALALMQIADCEEQLGRVVAEPLRLVQAAKCAHSALQAALTAGLAGSMGIGAYNEKLEGKWREFLQEGTGEHPNNWHVMPFKDLLKKARAQPLEWAARPLELKAGEERALDKLTTIRDGVEHPKPGFWVIEPAWIYGIIPSALRLTLQLLRGIAHQLEPRELDAAMEASARIEQICRAKDARLAATASAE